MEPPETVIIRPGSGHETSDWRHAAEPGYAPRRQVFILDDQTTRLGDQPFQGDGAWLCRGTHCLPPVERPDELREQLAASADAQ